MWVITKRGFVSFVKHNSVEDALLARARRREDLAETFPELADQISCDNKADYRWRLVVPVERAKCAMLKAFNELDYTSHAKEAMAGADQERYGAYMSTWTALMRLQDPSYGRSTSFPRGSSGEWFCDDRTAGMTVGDIVDTAEFDDIDLDLDAERTPVPAKMAALEYVPAEEWAELVSDIWTQLDFEQETNLKPQQLELMYDAAEATGEIAGQVERWWKDVTASDMEETAT